jgi:hypothetical protein
VTAAATKGWGLIRASWTGTAVFSATSATAALAPADGVDAVAFGVAVVMFGAGCVAFALAYSRVLSRSRTELIGVAQVYLLTAGVAPGPVRRHLLGALTVQVVVAIAAAAMRPYSSLAAGTLAPMFGLGLCGMWAARYGTFPPRADPPRRPGPRQSGP